MRTVLPVWLISLTLVACRPPTPPPPTAQLTVVNGGNTAICDVYISPRSHLAWGDDWLGDGEILPAGSERDLTLAAGTYDLEARRCNGDETTVLAVALHANHRWTVLAGVRHD